MDDDFCLHEAWNCKAMWHRCNDCNYEWDAEGLYGRTNQMGVCSICKKGPVTVTGFVTKDSGERAEYASGMVRDTQEGKPRFDLLLPLGVPYEHQFLTRVAELLARGAEKYSDRNWERAGGDEELARFKSSAQRHLMQWLTDETDEDHAAAVVFNLLAYETIKWKLGNAL